ADGVAVVVVNGSIADDDVIAQLKGRRDIRLFFSPKPGVSAARALGRREVDTPFFGTLDDDDELLASSISVRVAPMLADPTIDVVVSNGYHELQGARRLSIDGIDRFQQDPLMALMDVCWLNSAGGLYRSSRVEAAVFDTAPDVMEWTHLAFQLA